MVNPIDQLSLADYTRYASDVEGQEIYNKDNNIENAMDIRMAFDSSVILDYNRKYDAMIGLMGLNLGRRGAYLKAPPNFHQMRFSFFEQYNSPEKDALDVDKANGVDCSSSDQREYADRVQEQKVMSNFCEFKQQLLEDYNSLSTGRYHFLQG